MAGHYVFSSKECCLIKEEASRKLQKKNIHQDEFLKSRVKESILRYLLNFRLVIMNATNKDPKLAAIM